jgi:MFS family permease
MVQAWIEVIIDSLQGVWAGAAGVLGNLVGALIVLIIGLIVASGIAAIVERLIRVVKLDSVLEKLGVEEHLERAGLKLDSARFFSRIVYWFFVIVFLLAASDILRFYTLSSFLEQVLLYVPNVVVAALIMLAAIVVGHFLKNLVTASIKGARLHSSNFLGSLTFWAVAIFGFFAALTQLGVAVSIINSLVTGFIAMIALAGGIAFGLGGKGVAEDILERLQGHVSED